jgi:hypothetical protein
VKKPRYIPPHLRTGGEEQKAVLQVLASCGWRAYSTSDPKVRRQTKGIPDVVAFKPGRVLFWETKVSGAKLTGEQAEFGELAVASGAEWGWGDSLALVYYLGRGVDRAS